MTHPSILVTGAASGIGESVVHRFANRNWHVGLLDRDAGALESVRDDLGHDAVSVHAADVTDPAAMQDAVADFGDAAGGRMDVLFNSAGVMTVGRFEELDLDVHRRHLDVNVFGVVVASRAAFPLLRDTPSARVISMASASGVYGTPELATYAASKAGVRSLTQALNLEWARHDIHVCDVLPPYVDSPMTRRAMKAKSMEKLGIDLTPEDVADVVEQAVDEDKIHWPVGKQFQWLYRLSEVLPSNLVRLIMRYVSGF
jgi:NAD(P)-dependent dehydrogenase (short-subunit alcohol dehydrogenase family)